MLPTGRTTVSRTLLVLVALAGLAASGCTTRVYARGYAHYSPPVVVYSPPVVFVSEPELVYVEPGLYVVRDYGDPVYYSDGYYWSYRGGYWYQTAHWSDPWVSVHVSAVPHSFAYRDHSVYVHYHGSAGAAITHESTARTYHTAAVSAHASAASPPSPAPPQAQGSASGEVHVGSGDRSAAQTAASHSSRGDVSTSSRSDTQAKVITPQPDKQSPSSAPQSDSVARAVAQPSHSAASRPQARPSSSSSSRSASPRSKSKRH